MHSSIQLWISKRAWESGFYIYWLSFNFSIDIFVAKIAIDDDQSWRITKHIQIEVISVLILSTYTF